MLEYLRFYSECRNATLNTSMYAVQVYIVGGADGYHISGTDSVMIINIEALGEPTPCLYEETSRPDWWTDYRAGNMANYPYAKQFLKDEPAPLTPL